MAAAVPIGPMAVDTLAMARGGLERDQRSHGVADDTGLAWRRQASISAAVQSAMAAIELSGVTAGAAVPRQIGRQHRQPRCANQRASSAQTV